MMKPNLEKMKQYIADHPVQYGEGTVESLMDMFYRCYAEHNPLENEAAREKLALLRERYREEGYQDEDILFMSVLTLCAEYQQVAFQEGFRTGAQWTMETFAM